MQTVLRVALHDLARRVGRLLAQGGYEAGMQTFQWDGRNDAGVRVSPGMYFLVVRSGDGHFLRDKVLLVE
jgi:flagellar hook assembly protein FlgD